MCSFAFSCTKHDEHDTNCINYIGRHPCSNYSVVWTPKTESISFAVRIAKTKKRSDQNVNANRLYIENGSMYAMIDGTRKYIDSTGLADVFFWVCHNNDQIRLFHRLSDAECRGVVGAALSDNNGNWRDCHTL